MKRMIVLVTAGLAIGMLSAVSFALPRFASQTGAKCQSCHINPSGGAMRQTFGVQYGREQLPVPEWSKEFEMEDFTNIIANVLGVGADFRTLYFYQQKDSVNNNAFFQMQGDIYLNFRVAKKVSMFLKKGLRSGYEVFGLLNILPASGHVKVGKFVPAFGTKVDDHTAYIRTETGFSPETGRPELTGAEVGVSPGPVTVFGGIYNASTDDFGSSTGSQKAFLGRAEGMFKLGEGTTFGVGANLFSRQNAPSPTVAGYTTTYYGVLGSFSFHNLTIFGEADQLKNNGSEGVTGVVTYVEANYVVIPGVDLKVAYDFYDPNKDIQDGAKSRYSFGFEFFPITGVEVRPMYRIVKDQPVDIKNDEFHLIIHFYL
jgi:hypothetical protein